MNLLLASQLLSGNLNCEYMTSIVRDFVFTGIPLDFYYRIRPNYRTVRLGFSELVGTLSCGKIWIYLLRVHYKKSE